MSQGLSLASGTRVGRDGAQARGRGGARGRKEVDEAGDGGGRNRSGVEEVVGDVSQVDGGVEVDEVDGVDGRGAVDGDGDDGGLSVMAVIRRLQSGELSGEDIGIEVRRECVGHLTDEGFSSVEIAEVLGTHERMVRRDRAALRKIGRAHV